MDEVISEKKQYAIHQGDSLELLKNVPDKSIDMVFADPPYFLSNGGITVKSGRMVSVHKGDWDKSNGIEADVAFMREWIQEIRRVLKHDGTLWITGTYHSIYICGYILLELGYKILNDIAWYKPNGAPNLSGRYFTASHENVIWAKPNHKGKHTFNYEDMKQGDWAKDLLKKPGKQMRSVWSIPSPGSSEKKHGKHPTQKPLALLERIVLSSTNKNDVVLDPFSGSGTTGVAAIKHGRRYIGIELDEEFASLSQLRLREVADLTQSQALAN